VKEPDNQVTQRLVMFYGTTDNVVMYRVYTKLQFYSDSQRTLE